MKKSLALAILGLAAGAVTSKAQGTVLFQNYFSSTSPKIAWTSNPAFAPAGKAGLALGGSWAAELGWFNGVTSDPNQISLVPASVTYFSINGPGVNSTPDGDDANAAGYFFGNVVSLSGAPAGSTVTLQIFAFNGASLGSAIVSGNSALFQRTLGGGALPSASMVGFPNFVISIPEPSVFALTGLGSVALLAFRRKK
jgi:hypothetical protein